VGWRQSALESVVNPAFWSGRKVFVTGHTGFNGAWLLLLLRRLGADVHGFALPPEDDRGLFVAAGVERDARHTIGDVRDPGALQRALASSSPEIVIHLAAQSLVRRSYASPAETFTTNVTGTVNLLEAARRVPGVRAIVVVTSDKCYENIGQPHDYRETDPLGGHDPYSSSKGCAEIVIASYRRSFLHASYAAAVATVRAGNMIGGGDWAEDRLVPDAMRAFAAGAPLHIRNPDAVRPWQHVFEPSLAYLRLAELLVERGHAFAEAWNIGPSPESVMPVSSLADALARFWGAGARWTATAGDHPHEARYLTLDCTKARTRLGWRPLIELQQALALTVAWYRAAHDGADVRALSLGQVDRLIELNASRLPAEASA
jgi:CDP-glucose 4,6-dehydratase